MQLFSNNIRDFQEFIITLKVSLTFEVMFYCILYNQAFLSIKEYFSIPFYSFYFLSNLIF